MPSPPPVAAKDVQVAKLYRAYCRVPGCGWHGELRNTFAGAGVDRLKHLDEHRTLPADPVLAAAITDRNYAAGLYAQHDSTCQLPPSGCDQHKSLAGHVARTEAQVALLGANPGETAEMF
jgi:hypothetical protein